ncbi:Caveolin-2 [Cymbomonas tetramitiformis]|uniref:Caveolin-2 n=1 Tax=Cymbomonas tetramitiformis TaxID=36881 RepID=A0AAE0FKN0_9CHLO|nr:Caveolin-2 [Cymbomonas tetramitiformis]
MARWVLSGLRECGAARLLRAGADGMWWWGQVLTGEDWNEVMYDAMHSVGNWAVVFFLALVIMGNYVVVNLFIAILLTSFEEHREDLKREALEVLAKKRVEMKTLQSIVWSVRSAKLKESADFHEDQATKKSRSSTRLAAVFLGGVLSSRKSEALGLVCARRGLAFMPYSPALPFNLPLLPTQPLALRSPLNGIKLCCILCRKQADRSTRSCARG